VARISWLNLTVRVVTGPITSPVISIPLGGLRRERVHVRDEGDRRGEVSEPPRTMPNSDACLSSLLCRHRHWRPCLGLRACACSRKDEKWCRRRWRTWPHLACRSDHDRPRVPLGADRRAYLAVRKRVRRRLHDRLPVPFAIAQVFVGPMDGVRGAISRRQVEVAAPRDQEHLFLSRTISLTAARRGFRHVKRFRQTLSYRIHVARISTRLGLF